MKNTDNLNILHHTARFGWWVTQVAKTSALVLCWCVMLLCWLTQGRASALTTTLYVQDTTNLRRPVGMDFDSLGNLYVTTKGNEKLFKILPGGVITEMASGFFNPAFVMVDPQGNVYVSEDNGNVSKVTPGGVKSLLAVLDQPEQMFYHSGDGLMYIARHDGVSTINLTTGQVSSYWENPTHGHTWGLTKDPNGRIFTVTLEGPDMHLYRLDPQPGGGVVAVLIEDIGMQNNPKALVSDQAGNLYLGIGSKILWKFPNGLGPEILLSHNELNEPQGLAIHPVTGDLYIAESEEKRIVYASTGLDMSGPSVAVTVPTAGQLVNDATPLVSVTYSDPQSGVNTGSLQVTVDGANVTGNLTVGAGDAMGSLVTALADGLHTLQVTLQNTTGIPTVLVSTFTVDATAPALTVTAPATDIGVTSTPLAVSGTLVDGGSGTQSVTVNGQALALAGGGFSDNVNLTSGVNVLSFVGTDVAGNSATVQRTVTYTPPDLTPPVATLSAPGPGQLFGSGTVAVTGAVTDNVAVDGGSVQLKLDGVAVSAVVALPSVTYTANGLGEGAHQLTLDGADTSANAAAQASVNFTVDLTAPVLAVTSPLNGTVTNQNPFTVTGTATDNFTPATVQINGVNAPVSAGSFSLPVTLAEGPNTLTVIATDGVGHTSTQVLQVTLDTAAPSLTVTQPLQGLVVTQGQAIVVAGATEVGANVTVNGVAATNNNGSYQAPSVAAALGVNTFTVTAVDAAGNTTTMVVTATGQQSVPPDTTGPVVSLAQPAADGAVATANVTFQGTVTDDLSGVAQLLVNGSSVTLQGQSFQFSQAMSPGVNTVTLQAVDGSGNAGSPVVRTLTYTPPVVDATPPQITLTQPPADTTVTTASLLFEGTVTDGGTGVALLTLNGVTVTLQGGAFSFMQALNPGPNVLTFQATDNSGNAATLVRQIQYTPIVGDTAPPQVLVQSPQEGIWLNTQPVSLEVVFTDDQQVNVNTINISLDGSSITGQLPAAAGSATQQVVQGMLPNRGDGAHFLTITVQDGAGKTSSATRGFNLDTQPPVLTLISHPQDIVVSQASVTLLGTVADGASGVSQVMVNGAVAAIGPTGFNFSMTLAPGQNVFSIQARDNAGNFSAPVVRILTYSPPDPNAPQIQLFSPTPGQMVTQMPFGVSAGITDNEDIDRTSVVILLDGASVTLLQWSSPVGVPVTVNTMLEAMAEGGHFLSVEARDINGNAAPTASAYFVVDTQPPTLNLMQPQGDITVSSAEFMVSGQAVDEGSGVVSVMVNGRPLTLTNGQFQGLVFLSPGPNALTFQATDGSGKSVSVVRMITLSTQGPPPPPQQDHAPPVITVTFPTNSPFETTEQMVTVTGTIQDDSGLVATASMGNTPLVLDAGGNFSVPATLQGGGNVLVLTAMDGAGNVVTTTLVVTRTDAPDTTPPFIQIIQPARDPAYVNMPSVLVEGVTEPGASLNMDNTPVLVLPDGRFQVPVSLQEGVNSFLFSVTDQAGNVGDPRLLEILLDTLPPAVSWLNPTAQGNYSPASSLRFRVEEPQGNMGSGVDQTRLSLSVDGVQVSILTGSSGEFLANTPSPLDPNTPHTFVLTVADRAGNLAVNTLVTNQGPPPPPPPSSQAQLVKDSNPSAQAVQVGDLLRIRARAEAGIADLKALLLNPSHQGGSGPSPEAVLSQLISLAEQPPGSGNYEGIAPLVTDQDAGGQTAAQVLAAIRPFTGGVRGISVAAGYVNPGHLVFNPDPDYPNPLVDEFDSLRVREQVGQDGLWRIVVQDSVANPVAQNGVLVFPLGHGGNANYSRVETVFGDYQPPQGEIIRVEGELMIPAQLTHHGGVGLWLGKPASGCLTCQGLGIEMVQDPNGPCRLRVLVSLGGVNKTMELPGLAFANGTSAVVKVEFDPQQGIARFYSEEGTGFALRHTEAGLPTVAESAYAVQLSANLDQVADTVQILQVDKLTTNLSRPPGNYLMSLTPLAMDGVAYDSLVLFDIQRPGLGFAGTNLDDVFPVTEDNTRVRATQAAPVNAALLTMVVPNGPTFHMTLFTQVDEPTLRGILGPLTLEAFVPDVLTPPASADTGFGWNEAALTGVSVDPIPAFLQDTSAMVFTNTLNIGEEPGPALEDLFLTRMVQGSFQVVRWTPQGGQQPVSTNPGSHMLPSVSPQNFLIYSGVSDQGEGELWVQQLGQGPPGPGQKIGLSGLTPGYTSVAPDQPLAVFDATDEQGKSGIYLIDGPTSDPPRVSGTHERASLPSLGLGGRLAYVVRTESGFEIVTGLVTGGVFTPQSTVSTPDARVNTYPTYSVDGQWLYFLSDAQGELALYRQPAQGPVAAERLPVNPGQGQSRLVRLERQREHLLLVADVGAERRYFLLDDQTAPPQEIILAQGGGP